MHTFSLALSSPLGSLEKEAATADEQSLTPHALLTGLDSMARKWAIIRARKDPRVINSDQWQRRSGTGKKSHKRETKQRKLEGDREEKILSKSQPNSIQFNSILFNSVQSSPVQSFSSSVSPVSEQNGAPDQL